MKSLVIFAEIDKEMEQVDETLRQIVKIDHPVLAEASSQLLQAGGKRLRPAFVLLAGKLYANNLDKLIPLAAAVELIHMASLVHDDVVDCSITRRGVPTVRVRWGNQIALNTGDYLFAQALNIISQYNNARILDILADVSVKMCEGEVQQIVTAYDTGQTVKDYLYRIKRKTALLISTSCLLGAIVSEAPENTIRALGRYGHYLGMAFQITDDLLDFTSSEEVLGKAVGGDLAQGIITLPVIYTLREKKDHKLRDLITRMENGEHLIDQALLEVVSGNGLKKAQCLSQRYISKAEQELRLMPDFPARATLFQIAEFVNSREF